ncbi:sensor histidine kinase [Cohnella candidum]|nr:GAF domain-containing sensor histidine kinase [Cohnella candidum]
MDSTTTRLRTAALAGMHALWWALALLSAVVSIYNHALGFDAYAAPCSNDGCFSFFQMNEAQFNRLSLLGIDPGLYNALTFVLLTVQNLSSWAVGILLYRYGWKDFYCLTASLMLIVTGTIFNVDDPLFADYPRLMDGFLFLNVIGSLYLFFLFLLPYGRFVPRWTAVPALLWLAGVVFGYLLPDNPYLNSMNWNPILRLIYVNAVHLLVVGVQIARSRKESSPERRRQIRWFAVGMLAYMAGGTASLFPAVGSEGIFKLLMHLVLYSGLFLLPFSIGLMAFEQRIRRMSKAFNRALVYVALSIMMVMAYALLVGGLGLLFRGRVNDMISLLSAGFVAVLFQPLRSQAQTAVNRLVYGDREDPHQLLSGLTKRLEGALTHHSLLPAVAETIAQALRIPYAAVEVDFGNGDERIAAYGTPGESESAIPLDVQGERVGRLVLGIEEPRAAWPPGRQTALDDLIRQVSIAVQSVRLTEELHRSRERIVIAREEERRRLRRDLHDGLGSSLASMMLRLDEARQQHGREPAQSLQAIVTVQAQMGAALDDIRRLVYQLRPPVLDELGLRFALRELALQFQDPSLEIRLDDASIPSELPAAAEVAVYRIVQEALTNVVRHSGAKICRIRAWEEDGELRLTVEDDGIGMAERNKSGVGVRSMKERAEELGGHCAWDSEIGGGTRIRVELPLAGGRSA